MIKKLNKSNFIDQYYKVKGVGFKTNKELASALGYSSPNSITEIISERQLISDEKYEKFTEIYKDYLTEQKNNTGVPFYDLDVTASITGSYLDIKETPEYYIDFQPFNDCDAFTRVYGDSMYPKFASGEIIAIKRKTNFDAILWGEAHLIVTDGYYDDLRTIKTIHPCEDDHECVILRASNPAFKGDTRIKKKHIIGLFTVKGKTRIDQI